MDYLSIMSRKVWYLKESPQSIKHLGRLLNRKTKLSSWSRETWWLNLLRREYKVPLRIHKWKGLPHLEPNRFKLPQQKRWKQKTHPQGQLRFKVKCVMTSLKHSPSRTLISVIYSSSNSLGLIFWVEEERLQNHLVYPKARSQAQLTKNLSNL